jgi:hypothetical protein
VTKQPDETLDQVSEEKSVSLDMPVNNIASSYALADETHHTKKSERNDE